VVRLVGELEILSVEVTTDVAITTLIGKKTEHSAHGSFNWALVLVTDVEIDGDSLLTEDGTKNFQSTISGSVRKLEDVERILGDQDIVGVAKGERDLVDGILHFIEVEVLANDEREHLLGFDRPSFSAVLVGIEVLAGSN
jgi:hypothetical protein